jgi:tetratricopeptide (TPR) repeat protein
MQLLVLEGSYYLSEAHSPSSLRLLELAASQAEPRLSHEFLAKLGNYYLNSLGLADRAVAYFERAYTLAKNHGPHSRQAVYQCLMAIGLLKLAQPQAGEIFEAAYGLIYKLEATLDKAIVLANYGYFHAMQGNFLKAQDLFVESLNLSSSLNAQTQYERTESFRLQFFALNNLAQCLHETKAFEASIAKRNEALELAKQCANGLWVADAFYGLGESYHALAKPGVAETMFNEALERYEALRAEAYATELRTFMQKHTYRIVEKSE